MNVRQQPEQPERREGFGGRVRRFIDSEIGRAMDSGDRPAAAPVDAEVGTSAPDGAPVEEPAPSHRGDRRADQAAADGSAERVGLLTDPAGLRHQWQQVQGTFVDDPQRAVHEASVLVDRTLREIHGNVSRGQISDPTSTEDLRVSFQRYREFFQRLLSA